MRSAPTWRGRADAWFKFLGAIVFGYLILNQVVALLRQFFGAAIILVGGILVAYVMYPAVGRLSRRMPLAAAVAVVYGAAALLIALVGYVVVPLVSAQFVSFVHNVPALQHAVERFVSDPRNPVVEKLPPALAGWIRSLPGQIAAQFQARALTYGAHVVGALGAITYVAALAIAIPVVSIYMLAEAQMIRAFVFGRIPLRWRASTMELVDDIDAVLGGFVRGQLIVATVVGVLAAIALLILHVPYPLLIGAWAGVADVIPYVGPFAGALPAGIVAIVDLGWPSVIGVVAAFTAINQLEAHLLGPRIVSRTVRVSPLGIIFALIIAGQLFGFVGLIVAVPLAGLVRIAVVRCFPERG